MASRKDQLQSYQFMMQRVISSIMLRETDPEQTPLRRGVGAVFGGVMLTGLLAIAFAVYGIVSGNMGTRWQQDNALVIERETGAVYIYHSGVLQPVLNYASARLLVPGAQPQRVPGRNLAGIPRRPPVGIPGAPDSLPPAGRLVGAPWTMCSVLGEDPAGRLIPTTVLLVGAPATGTTPLGRAAVLVRDAESDAHYLVWRSHRYEIVGDPDGVIQSLYGTQAPVTAAGTAWLNGLPAGESLGPIEVDGSGEPSAAVPGRDIGELLFHPIAGGRQHYLVLDDGLAAVTDLQVLLLRGTNEPVEIAAAEASALPSSDALAPAPGSAALPPALPQLASTSVDGRVNLCAETRDGRTPPELTLGQGAVGTQALQTGAESPDGVRLADLVLVPPGHGAVVRALSSETAEVGAYQLVTDLGLRYPVPSAEALTALGYSTSDAVDMPTALVERIPAGPTLDPAAAQQPVSAQPGSADPDPQP